jgi:hypothetical protein
MDAPDALNCPSFITTIIRHEYERTPCRCSPANKLCFQLRLRLRIGSCFDSEWGSFYFIQLPHALFAQSLTHCVCLGICLSRAKQILSLYTHAMQIYSRSRGISPLIRNLGTLYSWMATIIRQIDLSKGPNSVLKKRHVFSVMAACGTILTFVRCRHTFIHPNGVKRSRALGAVTPLPHTSASLGRTQFRTRIVVFVLYCAIHQ